MHPLLRSKRGEARATFVRLLAYFGGLAALSILAATLIERQAGHIPMVVERVSAPADWIVVERPYPAFAIAMPELPEASFSYAIHRHSDGNRRKDILSWGESAGVPRTLIEIYRSGTEQQQFGNVPAEVAARLPSGTVLAASEVVETKFGPTPFVKIALQNAAPLRQCLGFARAFDDPRMQIAGWWCGESGEAVERSLLACAIDRLMLLSAASDPKVGRLFAQAELKRDYCGKKPVPLSSTIRQRKGPAKDDPKRAQAKAH